MSDVMVELAKVKAQLAELSAQRARGGNQEQAPRVDLQQPEVYTWDQLQQAVQNGEITEATAQHIYSEQNKRSAEETARRVAREERAEEQREARLNGEIAAYHSKIPDLKVEGSADFARVQSEYKNLVEMGYDDNKRTALVALSRIYGPASAIAKQSEQEPSRDTHKEGSSGPDDGGADNSEAGDDAFGKPPSGLSKAQSRHYSRMLDQGIYKDWNEVREELKFAKKRS